MNESTATDQHEQALAATLADAVGIANVPTLLMVLVQLTGDRRWLGERYRPSPSRGLGDNDTGGLPDDVQDEIRDAACEAILAWHAGAPVAIPEPSEEMLVEMLGTAMGEPIPPEYGPMIRAELAGPQPAPRPAGSLEGLDVIIIGAGASGLCAAVYLQQVGIPFTILEQHADVGGVWLENRYPGAGVDTPNHLYSFSFAAYDWSRYFALRDELHGYLDHVASSFELRQNIRFETKVERAWFDEPAQRWRVEVVTPSGGTEQLSANVLISAAGVFNPPVIPQIKGLDDFAGPCFHTACWPDVELAGKRVAIIGNGASAMQTAPAIADVATSLTIFQRSRQWAAPFEQFQKPVPDAVRCLLREVPLYRLWYRLRLGWTFNDKVYPSLQKDPAWPHAERSLNAINDGHRAHFTRYIQSELGDRQDLLDKVLPDYPPFGKRMLMDNGWFRMLRRDDVELVTDGIEEIRADRIVDRRGVEHEVDVIVLATGFDVIHFLSTYELRGRGGATLREVWDDDDARAYLGMVVPGFPNFFCLYGPNTQPGHGGSLLFVIERQMHYIRTLLLGMVERGLATVECRPDVHDRYNESVDRAHEQMVWTHRGMETYYRNSRGRVVVNLPYRNVDLWHMTEHPDLDDYLFEPRRTDVEATVGR